MTGTITRHRALRHFDQWSEVDRAVVGERLVHIESLWGDLEFYTIRSDTYVGVRSPAAGLSVGWLHVGFIDWREPGSGEIGSVELSCFRPHQRGPMSDEEPVEVCPDCNVALPVVRECGMCGRQW